MERDRIIALIAEDIKHNQLLSGLNSIGLTENDRYTLSLDLVIAEMMGYKHGMIPDNWLDVYHDSMLTYPINLTAKEIRNRAVVLYNELLEVRP
ncbi:hypothetical protein [Fluviicola sp.]|uniref:hypothetical protein n=1 Tax=Fluviicola sp. TaxID=1917219 RepID=UPI0031D9B0F4